MAYTIMLDAGHGGEDPGAVYQNRQEKDDTLRLTQKLGEVLSENGVNVLYTRTTDIYQTPFEKAQIANRSGADYFISIHRNSSPSPNQYSGVETLVYDKSGIKLEMAENINAALAELGFKNLGVKERPGLVVLRRTRMPALLVEVGFLNTDADNALFDENLDEIARAIAYGILETLDVENVMTDQASPGPVMPPRQPVSPPPSPGPGPKDPVSPPMQDEFSQTTPLYRVQTGLFRQRENADRMLYGLLDKGYPAFLLAEDGYFKVQVGAFRQLSNAITMEQRLRRDGYATLITT